MTKQVRAFVCTTWFKFSFVCSLHIRKQKVGKSVEIDDNLLVEYN